MNPFISTWIQYLILDYTQTETSVGSLDNGLHMCSLSINCLFPWQDEDAAVEEAYYSEMRDAGYFDIEGDWD